MLLLVGLGNPGVKHAAQRHNAGFMAVDAIAEAHGFSAPKSKFKGEIREGRIGNVRALTLKPQTFYNESGNSVKAAAQFYKVPLENIIVFHDEIDLAPGKMKMKRGGGLAGNNGLKSTAAHMGPDFWRVRLGIGHPGRKEAVTPFVLGDFSKAEKEDWLETTLSRLGDAAIHLQPPLGEVKTNRFLSAIAQPGAKDRTPTVGLMPKNTSPTAASKKEASKSPFDLLRKLKGD
ncbi:MAG: aminoacyl-tRNA hydrolase [Pseudomonadota bacterium]